MAPRETPKPASRIQRNISITKTTVTKAKSSPVNTLKKTIITRNVTDKNSGKVPVSSINGNIKVIEPKRRTNTVPRVTTPNSKENKATMPPASVTKSAKKALWKRRPKPAHSGVPCPEKMRRLLEQQLQDCE